MTVLLECFVVIVHFIRVVEWCGVVYINVWVSVIQTFHIFNHTQDPICDGPLSVFAISSYSTNWQFAKNILKFVFGGRCVFY